MACHELVSWWGKKAERKIGRIQDSGMQSLESLILELTISSEQITFKIPFFPHKTCEETAFSFSSLQGRG